MKKKVVTTLMLAALGVAVFGSRASAAPVTYTIDPTESSLTVGIYLGGPPSTGGVLVTGPQVGTSDTASLSGTMNIDTTGGSISFSGGTITPLINPFPGGFLPALNGGSNTGPGLPVVGVYQFALDLPPAEMLGTGYASIYNATSSVTSLMPTALTAGLFDSTQQSVSILSANLAYWLNTTIAGLVYGSETAAPPALSARNGVDTHGSTGYIGSGSVTTIGPVTKVTLPLFADAYVAAGSVGLDIIFTGQVVADVGAPSIPEPASITLLGIALVSGGAVWAARRRRQK